MLAGPRRWHSGLAGASPGHAGKSFIWHPAEDVVRQGSEMESGDYATAWVVYLVASGVLAFLCWRVFRRYLMRELAYLLQCWLLAILLTPWYVLPEESVMAPAFIVFMMDAITIAPVAGIRALIPLVMAMFVMLVVAIALSVVYRIRRRRQVVADD
jgi:hypothetical protein